MKITKASDPDPGFNLDVGGGRYFSLVMGMIAQDDWKPQRFMLRKFEQDTVGP